MWCWAQASAARETGKQCPSERMQVMGRWLFPPSWTPSPLLHPAFPPEPSWSGPLVITCLDFASPLPSSCLNSLRLQRTPGLCRWQMRGSLSCCRPRGRPEGWRRVGQHRRAGQCVPCGHSCALRQLLVASRGPGSWLYTRSSLLCF